MKREEGIPPAAKSSASVMS